MNAKTLPHEVAKDSYLESVLQCRLGTRVRNLRLHFHPDGVILRGRASTYHAKQLAQQAVMELTDRRILANDIEVS